MAIPSYVTDFINRTIANEGGYQNDANDSGNIRKADGTVVGTNYGITPYTYAAYKGISPNSVTEADMQAITPQVASSIYEKDYWTKPKLDKIGDPKLAENVFDMAVNAGPSRAIKLLQEAVGASADGVLGPKTLKKLNDSTISTNDYTDARINFYQNIAAADPTKEKYLKGWANRAAEYYDSEALTPTRPDYIGDAIKEMYGTKEDLWADPVAKEYVVQSGDTLTSIAKNMGVSIADLVDGNGITNPNQIQVGQKLLF